MEVPPAQRLWTYRVNLRAMPVARVKSALIPAATQKLVRVEYQGFVFDEARG